jgi:hypothetical protein
MGTDFLKRMSKSFHRALDQAEVALRTPTLFTPSIGGVSRTARAKICKKSDLAAGERIMVRLIDGRVVGQREGEVEIILEFTDPPPECIDHLNQCGGIEIGKISVVLPISEAVEVEFSDDEASR